MTKTIKPDIVHLVLDLRVEMFTSACLTRRFSNKLLIEVFMHQYLKIQVFPHAKAEALSSSSAAAMNLRDAADDRVARFGLQ